MPWNSHGEDQHLGSLELASMMPTQREFRIELDLDTEDIRQFVELFRAWSTSPEKLDLWEIKRNASQALDFSSCEDCYRSFVFYTNQMNAINDIFLSEIDETLDSEEKSKRFRQLLRQNLLRLGDYECFLRTVEVEITPTQYKVFYDGFNGFPEQRQIDIEKRSRSESKGVLKIEEIFNQNAKQINNVAAVVVEAFGSRKAKQLLGKLVLPHSVHRSRNTLDQYEKLYKESEKLLTF